MKSYQFRTISVALVLVLAFSFVLSACAPACARACSGCPRRAT